MLSISNTIADWRNKIELSIDFHKSMYSSTFFFYKSIMMEIGQEILCIWLFQFLQWVVDLLFAIGKIVGYNLSCFHRDDDHIKQGKTIL